MENSGLGFSEYMFDLPPNAANLSMLEWLQEQQRLCYNAVFLRNIQEFHRRP